LADLFGSNHRVTRPSANRPGQVIKSKINQGVLFELGAGRYYWSIGNKWKLVIAARCDKSLIGCHLGGDDRQQLNTKYQAKYHDLHNLVLDH
jgi:hypothetical protein